MIKKKLSQKTRHSVETASINYNKISKNINISKNCDKLISELYNQIYELKKEVEILKIKINDNNHNNDNYNKLFNKRKNDILYLVTSGTQVKNSTK